MTNRNSRFPGFYKITVRERRELVSEATGAAIDEMEAALETGGLDPETADKFVENVLGTYALPFGVALNVRVNGKDYVVPMVVEEPSVIAAASNAAKMVRAGGGFSAEVDPPIMTCQVQLFDVKDAERGAARIAAEKAELLALANRAVPGLVERGGGANDLEVRRLEGDMLVVHIYVDCRDAMGANLVNNIAEAVGDLIADLGGGKRGLRILSNLCDRRRVRVRATVPADVLATETLAGEPVIAGIVNASRFAEADPYRAATHNKGIMNGIDAVCIATGNDWRAVEAGAHAFAARGGRYKPLATWRGEGGALIGSLELPLALGSVGGTLRVHPAARLALRLLGAEGASEVAAVAASVGLASNLAAVRALATDGIQRGHMALHARSVAIAAGAATSEVERIALMIVEARDITVDGAARAISVLRAETIKDVETV
jgi:hydroxymethylglutaryl-CoA reductase